MLSFDELHNQSHKISELSNVLQYLLKDRAMCDAGVCCELFQRYMNELTNHIDLVEREVYPVLLRGGGAQEGNNVSNFMNGSQEIKKIIKQYTQHWCEKGARSFHIKDHDTFYNETDELFEMVLQRLQDEAEKLYPAVRRMQ